MSHVHIGPDQLREACAGFLVSDGCSKDNGGTQMGHFPQDYKGACAPPVLTIISAQSGSEDITHNLVELSKLFVDLYFL